MAEVLVNEAGKVGVGGVFDLILTPLKFILANWFYFVIGLFLLIAVVIIITLIFSIKEGMAERDEPGYFNYKKCIRDCKDNAKKKLIRKKYSLLNLLWFGIPFKWKDRSARVLNSYGEKIGLYRGELSSQDGFHNFLVCKSKSFGFIENNIVIKVPSQIKVKNTKDKKTPFNVVKFNLIKNEPFDNSIVILCLGLERVGLYYHIPVIREESGEVTDFREYVEGVLAENIYATMYSRQLGASMKQMEKAISINPNLKYAQMSPKKTNPETELDDEA